MDAVLIHLPAEEDKDEEAKKEAKEDAKDGTYSSTSGCGVPCGGGDCCCCSRDILFWITDSTVQDNEEETRSERTKGFTAQKENRPGTKRSFVPCTFPIRVWGGEPVSVDETGDGDTTIGDRTVWYDGSFVSHSARRPLGFSLFVSAVFPLCLKTKPRLPYD